MFCQKSIFDAAMHAKVQIRELKSPHTTLEQLQIRQIQLDYAAGRVIWNDSYWPDALQHSKDNHTLLGVFYAHPCNPYSRREHFVILLSVVFFSWFIATVVSPAIACPREFAYAFACGFVSSFYCLVLKKLATCSCAINTTQPFERCCLNCTGWCLMFVCFVCSLSLFVWSIVALTNDHDSKLADYFSKFAAAQFASWCLYDPAIDFLWFNVKRNANKKRNVGECLAIYAV